jgi:hypothetical protein
MLQLVPSHCGLLGNEKVDYLAKLGSHENNHPTEYHSTQPKHISKQQLNLKSKTNGIQNPRRKTGRP